MLAIIASDEADVVLNARGKANEGTAQENALVSGRTDPAAVLGYTNLMALLREVGNCTLFADEILLPLQRLVKGTESRLTRPWKWSSPSAIFLVEKNIKHYLGRIFSRCGKHGEF